MTRHPDTYEGAGTAVAPTSRTPTRSTMPSPAVTPPTTWCTRWTMTTSTTDAAAPRAFGAAAEAGLKRIVYLGGLGDDADELSAHLRSRREVEQRSRTRGVPVTTLRAGIIVGDGGISWEMTRQLVDHLPAMVTPRWVTTRTQPIAVADVVRYLVGILDVPEAAGQALEIGGPEVLRYMTMLRRVATIQGRDLPIVPVPLLSPSFPRAGCRW